MGATNSKFNMIRALIHMAHADKIIAEDELRIIRGYLDRIPFNDGQKKQLLAELDSTSNDIDGILAGITAPADRSMVVHFARVLCHCDGLQSPSEKQVLDHIHSTVMRSADVQSALADMGAKAVESMLRSERRPKFLLERFMDWLTSQS